MEDEYRKIEDKKDDYWFDRHCYKCLYHQRGDTCVRYPQVTKAIYACGEYVDYKEFFKRGLAG